MKAIVKRILFFFRRINGVHIGWEFHIWRISMVEIDEELELQKHAIRLSRIRKKLMERRIQL
jgi:hypothetical protein